MCTSAVAMWCIYFRPDASFSFWCQHFHHFADRMQFYAMTANSRNIKDYLHKTHTNMALECMSIHDGQGPHVVVHHVAYRILRQSRPSLRRWTASSSSWPSRRRRRRLPPAAAPLKTTAAPRDRGQHSAATSDKRACRPTLRPNNDATAQGGSSASASLRTAPERDARCVEQRGQPPQLLRGFYWLGAQSITVLSDSSGWCAPRRANHEWQLDDRDSVTRIKLSLISLTSSCHVIDWDAAWLINYNSSLELWCTILIKEKPHILIFFHYTSDRPNCFVRLARSRRLLLG